MLGACRMDGWAGEWECVCVFMYPSVGIPCHGVQRVNRSGVGKAGRPSQKLGMRGLAWAGCSDEGHPGQGGIGCTRGRMRRWWRPHRPSGRRE